MPTNFLSISDLDPADLVAVLNIAEEVKDRRAPTDRPLAGELVVLYFTRSSTRTRITFATAATRLGATVVVLGPAEFLLGRGPSVATLARITSLYANAIVTCADDDSVADLASRAGIPVVNGLSDRHHPCQSLADLLTLEAHFTSLAGLRLAYLGDGTGATNSLIEATALAGLDVHIASPHGHEPDVDVLARARVAAAAAGGSIVVGNDPAAAVDGADVVYSGPWSLDDPDGGATTTLSYPITGELMCDAAPHAVLLHCPPRLQSHYVDRALLRHPRSLLREQAANRLPCAAAMLLAVDRQCLRGATASSVVAAL